MKKFALLFAAACCLPVLGLTGCGSGETEVIQNTTEAEMSEAEQAEFDAGMEEAMNQQGPG
jgi:hypothetical protein